MAWREREAEKQGMVLAVYPVPFGGGKPEAANTGVIHAGACGALEGSVEEYLYDYYHNTVTSDGYHIIRPELPEGIEEKFWEILANAKPASYRTEQVLAIIEEEAELYFTGDKSIEEISAVIENRVNLYLRER